MGMRFLLLFCSGVGLISSQSIVLQETFDTQSNFIQTGQFHSDRNSDAFGIADPANEANSDFGGDLPPNDINLFSQSVGRFLFVEDVDSDQVQGLSSVSVLWPNLNIAGLSNLQFSGLFAASNTADFDTGGDGIRVWYTVDRGPPVNLLWFSEDTNNNDEGLAQDPNFDDAGIGTPLSHTFQRFTVPFSVSGTNLTLGVTMGTNGGGEQIGVDDIMITTV